MHTVSVVIPAYNAGKFVFEALDSIGSQERLPDEVIVVDDASTDDTAELARKFEAKCVTVQVVPGKGAGAAAALNLGIEAASGELIAHFDADDIMLPSKLRRQVEVYEQSDGDTVGLVSSDLHMFDERGLDRRSFLEGPKLALMQSLSSVAEGIRLSPKNARRALSTSHCIDVKGMYPKKCWEAVGGFDESYRCAYDMDFVWRVASRFDVVMIPEVLYHGRRHPGNLSGSSQLVTEECLRLFHQMWVDTTESAERSQIRERIRSERLDLAYIYKHSKRPVRAAITYARAIIG